MFKNLKLGIYRLNVKGCLFMSKVLCNFYIKYNDKKMVKVYEKDIKILSSILERLESDRNKQ